MDVAIFGGLRQRQTVGRFGIEVTPPFLQHLAQLNPEVGSLRMEGQHQRVNLCRLGICLPIASPIRSTNQLARQAPPGEYAMKGAHRRSFNKRRRDPLRGCRVLLSKNQLGTIGPG
jgi:hypothetical protein